MAEVPKPGERYTSRIKDLKPYVRDAYFARVFGLSYEEAKKRQDDVRSLVQTCIERWSELRPRQTWNSRWPDLVKGKLGTTPLLKVPPLAVYGPPGIGKSQIIRQAAKDIADVLGLPYTESKREAQVVGKFHLLDIRASQMEPPDILGLPAEVEREGMKYTVFAMPEWLPHSPFGILFFDELSLARPSVQSALYQLVLDEVITASGYELPGGQWIVSASNRPIDVPGVNPPLPPLANRFANLVIPGYTEEDVDEWLRWAVETKIHPLVVAYIDMMHAAGRGASTLFNYPGAAAFDGKGEHYAYATPRSWEMIGRTLYIYMPVDFDEGMKAIEEARDRLRLAAVEAARGIQEMRKAVTEAVSGLRQTFMIREDLLGQVLLVAKSTIGYEAAEHFVNGFLRSFALRVYSLPDIYRYLGSTLEELSTATNMIRYLAELHRAGFPDPLRSLIDTSCDQILLENARVIGTVTGEEGDSLAVKTARFHGYTWYVARDSGLPEIAEYVEGAVSRRLIQDRLASRAFESRENCQAAINWLAKYLETAPAGLPGEVERPEDQRYLRGLINQFKRIYGLE